MESADKKGRGRPLKLTSKLAKQICDFVRLGSWLETAAQACGVHRDSLRIWLKRGTKLKLSEKEFTKEEKVLVAFVDQIRAAAAESELIDLERIDKAAEQVWQAAAWRLERRHPNRWGQRQRHEHSGPGGKPIKTETKIDLFQRIAEYRSYLESFQNGNSSGPGSLNSGNGVG